jgi:hypothetical protein
VHPDRQHGARSELSPSITTSKRHKQPITRADWHIELSPELDTSLSASLTDLPYEPTTSTFSLTGRHAPSSIPAHPCFPAIVTQPAQRRCRQHTHAAPTSHDRCRNAPRARERARSRRQPPHTRALRVARPFRLRSIHNLFHRLQRTHRCYGPCWQRSTFRRTFARGHIPHVLTAAPQF